VVRNIVFAHGGQISFQSMPGSGTTFVVSLPLDHRPGVPLVTEKQAR
jgi:signal transduction histidine kinase